MSDGEHQQGSANPQPASSLPPPPPIRRHWRRTVFRFVLLIIIPVIALVAGGIWYEQSGRYVTTENAYVKAHVIAVSTNVDGRVESVPIRENQLVRTGELLFRIDPEPFRFMVRRAEAQREAARRDIDATRAEYNQIVSEIEAAKANVAYYEREAERQRQLARKNVTTGRRLDEAEFNLTSATRGVATLRQKLRTVLAKLGGDPDRPTEQHPDYMTAENELAMAELQLGYTEIRTPVDGIVTRLKLEPGEWVNAGESAFGLISVHETWIEANLKETQLTHVREGQAVTAEVDAYPDHVWHARIGSISPATGAEFSVLPPQNASGNWVKVVQRLPVRIELEQTTDQPPLRAGMTATISIDTQHQRKLWQAVKGAIAGRDRQPSG